MGRPALDLTGKKFFRLMAIKKNDSAYDGRHTYWDCQCDCGNIITVRKDSLLSGHAKSCGCYLKERYKDGHLKTHGMKHERIYKTWQSMKQRCCNPNCAVYSDYGGRGITICKEWLDDFMNFYNWAMANGYRDDLSIDRINVNGNYEPSNCRWANYEVQNYNKRITVKVILNGQEMTLKDIEKQYGIRLSTLRGRYARYIKGKIPVEDLICKEKLSKRDLGRE